jgi:ABC-2 type transport system ATP-binding protein
VLKKIVTSVHLIQQSIVLRAVNIMELMPAILETLKSRGVAITGVSLKENSLEDVFITLTGRRLRE